MDKYAYQTQGVESPERDSSQIEKMIGSIAEQVDRFDSVLSILTVKLEVVLQEGKEHEPNETEKVPYYSTPVAAALNKVRDRLSDRFDKLEYLVDRIEV